MAVTAVNPKQVEEYIVKADRESDNPTIFLLRGLTGLEQSLVAVALYDRTDRMADEDVLIDSSEPNLMHMVEFGLEGLKHGLVGWKNLLDDEGRQTPFKMSNKQANLDRLNAGVLQELALEVTSKTEFIGEELKNSDGPSTSRSRRKNLTAKSAGTGATATKTTPPRSRNGK